MCTSTRSISDGFVQTGVKMGLINKNRFITLSVVVMLGCFSIQGQAQQTRIEKSPAFTARQLLAQPRTGWLTNGGNLFNQRYSPLTAINRTNVNRLKGVWRTHLDRSGLEEKYSGEGQPLVYDGVIYITTGADDVFALSVATGKILWRYKANLNPDLSTVCCGWDNRGVAMGDGKIYVGQLDAKLVALDQRTGKPVWTVQAERWQDGFSITGAPLYYDGMVITGFAGSEFGVRGRIKAYDAKNGKLLWTFYTIPGPGKFGHNTWPQDSDAWKHGGATIWQTPAVDPELGLLYFSTANPGPDYNGSVRPGDNLFTSSIVAIDARTGKYVWHYQEVHHDLWDYDATNPVVLFDVKLHGVERKAIAEVNKTGWAYILDRTNGKPLIGIKERPVPQEPRQATAATQPYPVGDPITPHSLDMPPQGYKLVNQGRIFTPYTDPNGVIINPSLYGGANWPPSSYDPTRHTLYVCASDIPGKYGLDKKPLGPPVTGKHYTGGLTAFANLPRMGIFAAVDMKTNKIVWRHRWPDQCYSGSVATAGGLIFVGHNDGRLTALNSDNGNQLWEFQTGAGLNATASVFEYKGVQYVVVLSAGNVLVGTDHGDSVWLFSLHGKLDQTTKGDTPETPPKTTAAVQTTTQPNLASGAEVYRQTCVPCHGTDGMGGHGGGAPLNKVTDLKTVMHQVDTGGGTMPPFSKTLSAQQVLDVSAYVLNGLMVKK